MDKLKRSNLRHIKRANKCSALLDGQKTLSASQSLKLLTKEDYHLTCLMKQDELQRLLTRREKRDTYSASMQFAKNYMQVVMHPIKRFKK